MERQKQNVFRMRLMGAEVIPVSTGSRTLKDAINEALRDWSASYESTHYLLGTVAGPHPFPTMVRDFQRIIGDEAREQILAALGALPDLPSSPTRRWGSWASRPPGRVWRRAATAPRCTPAALGCCTARTA